MGGSGARPTSKQYSTLSSSPYTRKGSLTQQRRLTAFDPRRVPLHRRLATLLHRLSLRARILLLALWLFLFWRLGHTAHRTVKPTPPEALTSAQRVATTRDTLAFAPTSIRRTAARIKFRTGTTQDVLLPALPLPSRSSSSFRNDGAELEDEPIWRDLWSNEGEVDSVELPPGLEMTYEDPKDNGDEVTVARTENEDVCSGGRCIGLKRILLHQDLLVGLKQMREADSAKEMILRIPAPHRADDSSVTLVTQFSISRLARFENTLATWDGPVSVAIYLTDPEDIPALESYFTSSPTSLARYRQLAITVVKPDYSVQEEALLRRLRYPINRLRNLALDIAPSPFVVVVDADFLPSPGMHTVLSSIAVPLIRTPTHLSLSPTLSQTAIVISAFQLSSTAPSFPLNSSALHAYLDAHPPLATLTDPNAGHGPSLPSLLFTPSSISPTVYDICYEPQWEPYYLLARSSHPLYDERFTDQGGDKQSHALLLNALGYEFLAMREVWFMHPPKRDDDPEALEKWPSARLVDPELEKGHEGDEEMHFNKAAQRDKERFRYFQDYVPEIERRFGAGFRWPKGCSARAVGMRSVGKPKSGTIFGV